jgi:hypothetical protein
MNNNDIAILERIAQNVTAEEIGRCHKVYDHRLGKNVYLVENSHNATDEQGKLIEYKVTYDKKHGFRCNCLCGQYGFANCPNYCWHVRASVATALEEVNAFAGIAREVEERKVQPVEAKPIEVKWNIPAWMLNAPVAPHMKHATKER